MAAELLAGPYPEFGGVALTGVLDYPAGRRATELTAAALLRGTSLDPGLDVRALLAAAALAFGRDPETYERRNATAAVLAHARVIGTRGLRGPGPAERDPRGDLDAGADVLRLLGGPGMAGP